MQTVVYSHEKGTAMEKETIKNHLHKSFEKANQLLDNKDLQSACAELIVSNAEAREMLDKLESQSLHWQQEKPTKPCVVVLHFRGSVKDYMVFNCYKSDELKDVSADEYLILEEL
jgi:cytoplasmic iron level regulating protein YaaA (DUF328/UPF0246 family)